jgi:hypothetical protein
MKRFFLLIILSIIILSCSGEKKFYDVQGPELNFSSQTGDDEVLFQFDEPVSSMSYQFEDGDTTKDVKNNFPVANVYLKDTSFKDKKNKNVKIEATDTSGNVTKKSVKSPVINTNPVNLEICELQLKYSKTKNQYFKIKALSSGDISGFSVGFFIKNQKTEIPFKLEDIQKDTILTVMLNYNKEKEISCSEATFSDKIISLTKKHRLPQDFSLIYIKNNKDQIVDYIFYFDSKKHQIEDYRKNSSFKKMFYELKSQEIKPEFFDVTGISIKNPILRNVKISYK